MKRADVLKEIDDFIDSLKMPMQPREMANGWDVKHYDHTREMMIKIRDAVCRGGSRLNYSIVRTMDSWGVSGPLFDRACRISNDLDKIED